MPAKRKIQILVGFAMAALLPLLMAYSMIGETAHEYALDKPGALTVLPGIRSMAGLKRVLGFCNAALGS